MGLDLLKAVQDRLVGIVVQAQSGMIILKTSEEIELIARASRIVADVQQALIKEVHGQELPRDI